MVPADVGDMLDKYTLQTIDDLLGIGNTDLGTDAIHRAWQAFVPDEVNAAAADDVWSVRFAHLVSFSKSCE